MRKGKLKERYGFRDKTNVWSIGGKFTERKDWMEIERLREKKTDS